MKRIILLVVTAIMILNCSMSVCAEENIKEESVVQNYEMKTRAVATDVNAPYPVPFLSFEKLR